MWIFRYIYCRCHGHAYADIRNNQHSYQYCLRCGKTVEPEAALKPGRDVVTAPQVSTGILS